MKRPQSRLSRRNFLLAVGAGGAAAAAAIVVKTAGNAPAASGKKVMSSQGYHVTEHIRNYYRTARV
jgi:shikimate 5-dehydrogenase